MYKSDVLKMSVPVANSDHEPIVLIISLVVLTFVSLSLARCVQNKIVNRCEKKNIELETESEDEAEKEIEKKL